MLLGYVVSGLRILHQGGIRVIGQVGLVLVMLGGSLVAAQVEGLRFFEEKIRPLLSENCFECHGPEKQKAGLRLDGRGFILKGGENGPAIVVGNPGESLLIEAVSYRSSDLEMPPKRKLCGQSEKTSTGSTVLRHEVSKIARIIERATSDGSFLAVSEQ